MTQVHVKLPYCIVSYRIVPYARLSSQSAGSAAKVTAGRKSFWKYAVWFYFSAVGVRHSRCRTRFRKTVSVYSCLTLPETPGIFFVSWHGNWTADTFSCVLFWSNETFPFDDIKTSRHSSFLSAVQRIICFSPSVHHTFGHKTVIITPTILFPTRRKWMDSHYKIRYDTIVEYNVCIKAECDQLNLANVSGKKYSLKRRN